MSVRMCVRLERGGADNVMDNMHMNVFPTRHGVETFSTLPLSLFREIRWICASYKEAHIRCSLIGIGWRVIRSLAGALSAKWKTAGVRERLGRSRMHNVPSPPPLSLSRKRKPRETIGVLSDRLMIDVRTFFSFQARQEVCLEWMDGTPRTLQ